MKKKLEFRFPFFFSPFDDEIKKKEKRKIIQRNREIKLKLKNVTEEINVAVNCIFVLMRRR